MRRLMEWGADNQFLASLIISTLVIAIAVSLVSIEGLRRAEEVKRVTQERVEAVQQVERARAAAVVDVCQDVVSSVHSTIGAILADIRKSSEARGQAESPTLDRLDAINDRELDLDQCVPEVVADPAP